MGTSKAYGGPGGGNPLLPGWAQGDGGGDAPPESTPANEDIPQPGPQVPTPPIDAVTPPPEAVGTGMSPSALAWRRARFGLKGYVTNGGQDSLRAAGRGFSRASGGRKSVARSAAAGRGATTVVASFLTNVATRGVENALRNIGLAAVVGLSVETVLAEIVNKLAPDGATLDDVIARRTIGAAIDSVFARLGAEEDVERLNNMSVGDIEGAIKVSVAEFIFQKWMLCLGKRIEEFAINASDACKIEQEVKAYVFEATVLDLQGHDLLNADWGSAEYQLLINGIFEEAYGFLEDAQ